MVAFAETFFPDGHVLQFVKLPLSDAHLQTLLDEDRNYFRRVPLPKHVVLQFWQRQFGAHREAKCPLCNAAMTIGQGGRISQTIKPMNLWWSQPYRRTYGCVAIVCNKHDTTASWTELPWLLVHKYLY